MTTKLEKNVFTIKELMATGDAEMKYLLAPILPEVGLALIVGEPDAGKSNLMRQLCASVSVGKDQFLGFNLKTRSRGALYIATEDDKNSIKYLAKKQFEGLGIKYNDNYKICFANTLNKKDIIEIINIELSKTSVDLIVVDGFGDIFEGNDGNNNMEVRKVLKPFDVIASKHHCLIFFVHHVNKNAKKSSLTQQDVQGASALAQKVRTVISLTSSLQNFKNFQIIKANYCPREYKNKIYVIELSEETVLFELNEKKEKKNFKSSGSSNLNSNSKKQIKSFEENETKLYLASKITNKTCSHKEIYDLIMDFVGKSDSTIKRRIRKFVEQRFLIKNSDGRYSLNITT